MTNQPGTDGASGGNAGGSAPASPLDTGNSSGAGGDGQGQGGGQANGGSQDWRATLPQEYQSDPVFKNFKSQDDLLKSYKHTASLVGVDKAEIARKPKADAPAEEWDKFYNFLGRPPAPDKYEAPKLDGVELDKDYVSRLQKHAHANGWTQKQFESAIAHEAENAVHAHNARKTAIQNFKTEQDGILKKEWGAKYDENVAYAPRGISAFAESPEHASRVVEKLKAAGLAYDADIIKVFAKAGEATKESPAFKGSSPATGAMTVSEARMNLEELKGDAEFMAKYRSGDAGATAKMERLYRFAYPEEKK